jgi:hypothetical protein
VQRIGAPAGLSRFAAIAVLPQIFAFSSAPLT